MRHLLTRAGLTEYVYVESAGTGSWHVGEPADRRSIAHAARRGIVLDRRARQLSAAYFARFDLLLAADAQNLAAIRRLAPNDAERAKVHLVRSFEPGAAPGAELPDPYTAGPEGFEEVLDLCEAACGGLLQHLRTTYGF